MSFLSLFKRVRVPQVVAEVAMTADLQYRLIGTPSGHLWREVSSKGDDKTEQCAFCGTVIQMRVVHGASTWWDVLVTPVVPRCSHSYEHEMSNG